MAQISTLRIFCPGCKRCESGYNPVFEGPPTCSTCNAACSIADPDMPDFHPGILSTLHSQLWKYYGLDLDVEGWEAVPQAAEYGVYRIWGATEKHPMVSHLIKCHMLTDKVEDLYLHDGSEFIEPTTTPEEQEAR